MYTSLTGTFIHIKTQEPVMDASYWSVYESDDVEKVEQHFRAKLDRLTPLIKMMLELDGYPAYLQQVEYVVENIETTPTIPPAWGEREVTKL